MLSLYLRTSVSYTASPLYLKLKFAKFTHENAKIFSLPKNPT
jgi:hypothetical protein